MNVHRLNKVPGKHAADRQGIEVSGGGVDVFGTAAASGTILVNITTRLMSRLNFAKRNLLGKAVVSVHSNLAIASKQVASRITSLTKRKTGIRRKATKRCNVSKAFIYTGSINQQWVLIKL